MGLLTDDDTDLEESEVSSTEQETGRTVNYKQGSTWCPGRGNTDDYAN